MLLHKFQARPIGTLHNPRFRPKMLDIGSYSAFDFSEFTEENVAHIDAAISSHMQRNDDALTAADTSFQSELDGLNLTPEEFAQLDSAVFMKLDEHMMVLRSRLKWKMKKRLLFKR